MPIEKHTLDLFSYSINLERDLTIGNYTLILEREQKSPSPYFGLFLDRISETIRLE